MDTPVIMQGLPFRSNGTGRNTGVLTVHSMAEYLWYEGRLRPASEFLRHIGRSVHFTILPCGQVVKHGEPRDVFWHAKGANFTSVGVELLVPGVFTWDQWLPVIQQMPEAGVYTARQYDGLLTVMDYLVKDGYVTGNPAEHSWQRHSVQSKGRKPDPGEAFSSKKFNNMLKQHYGG